MTDRQWHDVFAGAGFDRPTADRFIAILALRIDAGRHVDAAASSQ